MGRQPGEQQKPRMLLFPAARSPRSRFPKLCRLCPHPRAGAGQVFVPAAVGKPAALGPGRSDRFAPGAGTDVRARSPNTSCPGPAELALLGTALLAWSSEPSPAPIPAHGRQNLPGKCGRLPAPGLGGFAPLGIWWRVRLLPPALRGVPSQQPEGEGAARGAAASSTPWHTEKGGQQHPWCW